MNIYLLYSITALFLVALSLILRKVEKSRPDMKFLWLSSVVPLAMALGFLPLSLYKPYASHSLLGYLLFCLFWCEYPGFIIASLIAPLFSSGWWFEEPVWLCVAIVVSFVLYTPLIFLVIRITLYLKKKFWSGKALPSL
jgi:hypothetical protein